MSLVEAIKHMIGYFPSLLGWSMMAVVASPFAYFKFGWVGVRNVWIFFLAWFLLLVAIIEIAESIQKGSDPR